MRALSLVNSILKGATMTATFQIHGLSASLFAPLFELPDQELCEQGVVRVIAPPASTLPCRVSLDEVAPGTELLLLPYKHLSANSPYQASGPIYVSRGAKQRVLPPGELPPSVTNRQISLRAYDAKDWITDAVVCDGGEVRTAILRMLANAEVAYIHLHNARRGCYSCLVHRVHM